MHIVWLYNERRKANDENEQCFCVGRKRRERREEKVMTEAATMGRSVTALPTQEASHHSGAPEVLLVQLKHRTSVCRVRTGGLCYRLNVVDGYSITRCDTR